MPTDAEIAAMTDEELDQVLEVAQAERDRRDAESDAKRRMDVVEQQHTEKVEAALTDYHRSEIGGLPDPDDPPAWVQPTGAHDAYPRGWVVTHDGKTWESLTPANAHAPGVSGWREIATSTEEDAPAADWVQPAGAHDSYAMTDTVTFEGDVWRSLINNNVWSPDDHPDGWEKVS